MNIIFNQKKITMHPDCTLQDLLTQEGVSNDRPYAVAVNHIFIPRAQHATTNLHDNDAVHVAEPMEGG